jgi:hypothetical protein
MTKIEKLDLNTIICQDDIVKKVNELIIELNKIGEKR